ncbi:MAG: hypothetical protein NVSMB62_19510 [Acidobacteriaceae bacterium]
MIAANYQRGDWPDPVENFVWTGAVTNHVSEVPENVPLACGGQNRIKGFKISVNVRKNKSAHGPRKTRSPARIYSLSHGPAQQPA